MGCCQGVAAQAHGLPTPEAHSIESEKKSINGERAIAYDPATLTQGRSIPYSASIPLSLRRGAIGIDLGTYNSCVAVFRSGRPEVIPNDHGSTLTPSVVAFNDGALLLGTDAKKVFKQSPKSTIFSTKRILGCSYGDPEVREFARTVPFSVVPSKDKLRAAVEIDDGVAQRTCSLEEVSAMVLAKMKHISESHLCEDLSKCTAVVTVPANFTLEQRSATEAACSIAGFQSYRLVSEPVAAAFAYFFAHLNDLANVQDSFAHRMSVVELKAELTNIGVSIPPGSQKIDLIRQLLRAQWSDERHHLLVFDLGGGTLDVSLVQNNGGLICVNAVAGDNHLGGDDFDECLVKFAVSEFQKVHGKSIVSSARSIADLRLQCERAKRELSAHVQATIVVKHEDLELQIPVSRSLFQTLCEDLVPRVQQAIEQVLEYDDPTSGEKHVVLTKTDVSLVALVGGATRMPFIRQMLEKEFGAGKVMTGLDPDHAIACGAAVQAGLLSGDKAEGLQDMLLLDSKSIALGIEAEGGVVTPLIGRNRTFPALEGATFTTAVDNQEALTIKLYETNSSKSLGLRACSTFNFPISPRLPAGEPEIEIFVDMDADSSTQLRALNKKTSHTVSWKVFPCNSLHNDEVEAMKVTHKTLMGSALEHAKEKVAAQQSCTFFFADADRLRESIDDVLPSFQTLRREKPSWLHEITVTWQDICLGTKVDEHLVISHRWETPDQPDITGVQLASIREHLKQHSQVRWVWYDFISLPQGDRTEDETNMFDAMLRNINLLYLGCSVLILMDMTYLSRFWTQFEAWLALKSPSDNGIVASPPSKQRFHIMTLHSAPASMKHVLVELLAQKTPVAMYDALSAPDIAVTNQRDKDVCLPKVLKIDAEVRLFFRQCMSGHPANRLDSSQL